MRASAEGAASERLGFGIEVALCRVDLSRAFSARPLLNRFLGLRFAPPQAGFNSKFRNLGIVLVLVVVLVLGALAFCAGKDPLLSCNYFVPLARL